MYRENPGARCSVCGKPAGLAPELSPDTGAPICQPCRARAIAKDADEKRTRAEALAMTDDAYRLTHARDARTDTARRCEKCGAAEVWVQKMEPVASILQDSDSIWAQRMYAGRTYAHACLKCGHAFTSDSTGLAVRRVILGVVSLAAATFFAVIPLQLYGVLAALVCGAIGAGCFALTVRRALALRRNPKVLPP